MTESSIPSPDPKVGLCSICAHHRVTGNRRGSRFYLCERSLQDGSFRRYPPLPMIRCAGFEVGAPDVWAALTDDREEDS